MPCKSSNHRAMLRKASSITPLAEIVRLFAVTGATVVYHVTERAVCPSVILVVRFVKD